MANDQLRQTLDRYLGAIRCSRRANTVAQYRSNIRSLIRYLESAHSDLESFSELKHSPHIEGWLKYLLTSREGRPLSAATRRRYISTVRRFLRDIAGWKWTEVPQEVLLTKIDLPQVDGGACAPSAPEKEHLRRIVDRYLGTIRLTRRPGTVNAYRNRIGTFVRYLESVHGELQSFCELRRSPHIEGWLNSLATRKDRPLGTGTRRSHVVTIRRFLQDIMDWEWDEAPLEELFNRSDLPPTDQRLPRPLSPQSDHALQEELQATGGLLEQALLLLRATGMRIGELRNLELDALRAASTEECVIHVPLGKLHSERVIPTDSETAHGVETIRRLRGVHPSVPHPDTGKLTDFLLLWPDGTRPSYSQLKTALTCAAERAQVKEHVTPHKLRHTYATEMIRNGMSLPVLMRLLGHRSIAMTMKYVKVTSADVREAYQKTIAAVKARYTLPEAPFLGNADDEEHMTADRVVSLLITAASRIEALRRDHENPHRKRIQRLAERIRRAAADLKDLTH